MQNWTNIDDRDGFYMSIDSFEKEIGKGGLDGKD